MDVEHQVFAKLTELIGASSSPLAVAFSGGGDSTALLSLVLKWSEAQQVHALIIDHALRPDSAKEAKLAQSRAKALGANAFILKCVWGETIPKTGIQEKARNARYQMLGDKCRELGIENLLLGHNQDDQAETVLMRKDAGSGWRGLAGIKERVRAPIWPALQGLNLVRPMLHCGRRELRSYNKNNGLQWIDDPSNANKTFARIRVREHLTKHPIATQNLLATSKSASETLDLEQKEISKFIQNYTVLYEWRGLILLPQFHAGQLGQVAESLKYILPAVSGQALPPDYEKRMNLARRLRSPKFTGATLFSGATLGGVRFIPRTEDILCVRDLGALTGRAGTSTPKPLYLNPAETVIWDGRFAVSAQQEGVSVDALANWEHALDASQKTKLKSLPASVRGGLPVFIQDGKIVHMPYIGFAADKDGFQVGSLTAERLSALLGDFYR